MPASLTPKIGFSYNYGLGENGWKPGYDENWVRADALINSTYGYNRATTLGLLYGYLGGYAHVNGAVTLIASGTVLLTNTATNYVERNALTGVVTANTTGFTNQKIPIAVIVTLGGAITSVTDCRLIDRDEFFAKNIYDVTKFGPTGVADDSALTINAELTAAATGTKALYPAKDYNIVTTINWNKQQEHVGTAIGEGGGSSIMSGSRIRGSGITLVAATDPVHVNGLCILDTVGNAATIGLLMDDGATGLSKFHFYNFYVISNHVAKLGIGVKLDFALEGSFINSVVEGWNIGLQFNSIGGNKSNANFFGGCKIRVCTYGMQLVDVDEVNVFGCIFEGSGTGIKHESGRFNSVSNHYENNVAPQRQIHATASANICSVNDGFYSGGADLEAFIESGAGRHSFINTVFNAGIKHTGTGLVTVINPVNANVPVAGTGPIAKIDGLGILGLQGLTATNFVFSGYLQLLATIPITASAGLDANSTINIGLGGGAPTTQRSVLLILNVPNSGGFVGGASIRFQRNSTELWNVGINAAVSGPKFAITDYYWLDSVGGFYAMGLSTIGDLTVRGTLNTSVAGQGVRVKEGANAKQGTAVLVAGTVTVANTSVSANSRIFAFCNIPGGTPGWLQVSARVNGTSFTILSSNVADTSTVAWEIFEPAP